ncbi:PREDICTED: nodulation-signaling pathway 1 protein-like [Nicotiana attenuata]|uniref:Nodulation-signaling pathway 1 protein n=1 Tax=Nicotiana attenuata TaxID=49451 RepID=A0A314KR12_NICAT|nr:PREDICTED: nodulation-signaling pathway 1 protein-like [Nicotiana attenuata]OIT31194.1 nodulation-signaling pathway 1 protein [Nicotiana attenuata]
MIKHQSTLSHRTCSVSYTMTIDEPEPNPTSDPISEWLDGTLSYIPSFLNELYSPDDFYGDSWWVPGESIDQEQQINNNNNNNLTAFNTRFDITTASTIPLEPIISSQPTPLVSSKKRKGNDSDYNPKASRNNQNRRIKDADDGEAIVDQRVPTKKSAGHKKATHKSTGNNSNNKEGRWAEQLLNPCAAAITAGNLNRVQHLLYVLHELSSLNGDANHRLAARGLQALTHYLCTPCSTSAPCASAGVTTFASTNPKFFKNSLINFNDISPWFRIPSSIANSSILQILEEHDQPPNLHILDIGVSHGVQWPTLLEELTHRSGGPPPLVRLTVITPTIEKDQLKNCPFVVGPAGYNFSSQLLAFAKAININLQINRLENYALQNLDSQVINSSSDETLVICAQFRLHNLKHSSPDERTEFLRILKSLEPKGVVLSENNMDCSCNSCGDFATGFSRQVEYLWKFLESTSVAYKGRESAERRMMEGEAAKALTNMGEMNERKEKWCERMRNVGFAREMFGEDAIDGARAVLKKYDSNWEMRVDEKDGCVGLWWKGEPVSFCSLWKIDTNTNESWNSQSNKNHV